MGIGKLLFPLFQFSTKSQRTVNDCEKNNFEVILSSIFIVLRLFPLKKSSEVKTSEDFLIDIIYFY